MNFDVARNAQPHDVGRTRVVRVVGLRRGGPALDAGLALKRAAAYTHLDHRPSAGLLWIDGPLAPSRTPRPGIDTTTRLAGSQSGARLLATPTSSFVDRN